MEMSGCCQHAKFKMQLSRRTPRKIRAGDAGVFKSNRSAVSAVFLCEPCDNCILNLDESHKRDTEI